MGQQDIKLTMKNSDQNKEVTYAWNSMHKRLQLNGDFSTNLIKENKKHISIVYSNWYVCCAAFGINITLWFFFTMKITEIQLQNNSDERICIVFFIIERLYLFS